MSEVFSLSEVLQDLYPERKENQWRTVESCVRDLAGGNVVSFEVLAGVASGVISPNDRRTKKIFGRANKMSGRVGRTGSREVKELCLVAIEYSYHKKVMKYELAKNVLRCGFPFNNKNFSDFLMKRCLDSFIGEVNIFFPKPYSVPREEEKEDQATKSDIYTQLKLLFEYIEEREACVSKVIDALSGKESVAEVLERLVAKEYEIPEKWRFQLFLSVVSFAVSTGESLLDDDEYMKRRGVSEDQVPFLFYLVGKQIKQCCDCLSYSGGTCESLAAHLYIDIEFILKNRV